MPEIGPNRRNVLASFGVGLRYAGPCIFSGGIELEQQRDDVVADMEDFNTDLTHDTSKWDAVMARTRWTGSILELGGTPLDEERLPDTIIIGRGVACSFEEGMNPGEQSTMRFSPVGDRWWIPSQDFIPPERTTCPSETETSAPRVSPKSFGNKSTTMSLLLGKSPAKMQEFRLFQGQTLQKTTRGAVAVTGEITSVDDSIIYADVPLCYQLAPFSGLRRDEIIRQLAAAVGLNPAPPAQPGSAERAGGEVICPIGKVVNKPILLSNASLLPFLNDFIAAENWFASFDEFGRLFIRPIELKKDPELPDWTLDAALGDFDFDSLEETPPAKPPSDIFVNVSQPVKGTGPGGSALTITTRTIEEDQELYNPECVKIPPSGVLSWLLGDGTYHLLPAEELMVVSRKITEITTVDGKEMSRVVRLFRHYNPAAYDPNFDTDPPGTDYDLAYGNLTFHRDECETLMEILENSVSTTRDIYGTILGTIEVVKSWYAPHRGGNYSINFLAQTNDPGLTPPAYIYAGGTTRVLPTEIYGVTQKIEKDYFYGEDGSLHSVDQRVFSFYSPDSRCDIVQTTTNPDSGPPTDDSDPEDPPITNPPPDPGPPPPVWKHPVLTGPISQDGAVFVFKVSISGAPAGSVPTCLFEGRVVPPGSLVPFYGTVGGTPLGHAHGLSNPLDSADSPEAFVSIDMAGTNQPDRAYYVTLRIFLASIPYWSNTITWNPWAALPPGGSF